MRPRPPTLLFLPQILGFLVSSKKAHRRLLPPRTLPTAQATFNAGVIATNGMQEAGVVTACAIPRQLFAEATQLALDGESEGYHIEPDDLGEYADRVLHDGSFTGTVYQMQCLCESTRLRFLGEKEALVAEHAVENGEEPNQDRVMNVAVDNLKGAILEARGRDSEC